MTDTTGTDPVERADPIDAAGLARLVELAESVARLAGDLVREGRPEQVLVASTKTSPTDIVTAMDTASEALLRKALGAQRPDDGILGEEGGLIAGTSGLTWVVDPIDGTVNYLYGIPGYAISVAVATGDPLDPAGHQVLAGCVHHPLTGETWTATLGGGAFLDGRPIRANTGVHLDRALVATGFGYDVQRRRHAARVAAEVLPRIRDIRRMGSAALDLAALACGRLDAYYERGLGAWDLAAAGLIAREAGALVGGLAGAPAGPELVVAAAPGLFEELQELLVPLRPDTDGTDSTEDTES
jgi:myo-inositol-1(or 4)-monophosphatase